jgi:glutamyl-tRNA synthetase
VSAGFYRGEGFLPEALLNFLVRLGWSHGDQEIFSVEEMTKLFDLDHVQKSAAVFNMEKLQWTNASHIKAAPPARLAALVAEDFAEHFSVPALARVRTPIAEKVIALMQPKVKTLKEIAEQLVPLCTPGFDASGLKWNSSPELKAPLQAAIRHAADAFSKKASGAAARRRDSDQAWGTSPSLGDAGVTHEEVNALLKQICDEHGVKLGDLAQPLRLAITGRMVSVGLFELLPILPWDVVRARMEKALGL